MSQITIQGSARAIILLGCFLWSLPLGMIEVNAATDSALQVTPHAHDFGPVKRLGGQVHTTFRVHNQGDSPLTIRRIWTS